MPFKVNINDYEYVQRITQCTLACITVSLGSKRSHIQWKPHVHPSSTATYSQSPWGNHPHKFGGI